MSDLECKVCDGGGTLTVPDSDGESASEQACTDPVHDGTVTAAPGQAAPAMPDSAVLRAAILATEDSGPAPVTWDGEARERLNRIIASWIRIELPPGTPAAATAAAAQRVTAGLAPYVEDEALRLSRNPVAAQEPHAAPELGTAWRLLDENRALLTEILDFLGNGIPPGDEFAHQVAQWRKRGLPS